MVHDILVDERETKSIDLSKTSALETEHLPSPLSNGERNVQILQIVDIEKLIFEGINSAHSTTIRQSE